MNDDTSQLNSISAVINEDWWGSFHKGDGGMMDDNHCMDRASSTKPQDIENRANIAQQASETFYDDSFQDPKLIDMGQNRNIYDDSVLPTELNFQEMKLDLTEYFSASTYTPQLPARDSSSLASQQSISTPPVDKFNSKVPALSVPITATPIMAHQAPGTSVSSGTNVSSSTPSTSSSGKSSGKQKRKSPERKGRKKGVTKSTDEYVKKRERNNIAVKKSREKAKQKNEETAKLVQSLKSENEQLQGRLSTLTQELTVLRSLFTKAASSIKPEDVPQNVC